MRTHRLRCLTLTALLVSLGGCAGSAALDSLPRPGEIRVDGAGDDWEGRLSWVEQLGLSVGAQHDEEAVYLAIATGDANLQAAILARGLTLWLDGKGGELRSLGLRYPVGMAAAGAGERPSGRGPGGGRLGGELPRSAESELARRERMAARLAALPAEFLILRGKDDGGRLTGKDEVPGLALAMRLEGSRLLFELRIPFASPEHEQRLLPLVLAGDQLGLGLALGPLPSRGPAGEGLREGGNEPPDGGMGGGPGGMGGGPGGMGGGPGGRATAPKLDGWVRLRLAP